MNRAPRQAPDERTLHLGHAPVSRCCRATTSAHLLHCPFHANRNCGACHHQRVRAACAACPWITQFDPVRPFPNSVLTGPGAQFLLGTDGNGMDVLSRTIYGARYAFGIAVPVLLFGLIVGVPIGLYAGYRGGWVDEITLRVMDAIRVFPSIILALAIVSATGQSLANVVLVIGMLDVPVFARLVRAEVLALRAGDSWKLRSMPAIRPGASCSCICCPTASGAPWPRCPSAWHGRYGSRPH